ncbi:MAG: isocitrate/isopropylmalate dehydrogenase family protein [Caldilineaceae bacterium]|nr:isocitrate/isopropylmalate dehydrogenase family protein [Caldilineaceae bacterium]
MEGNVQSSYRIAIIPGDGIGKEVVPAAQQVLAALPLSITFVPLQAGWEIFEQTGSALPHSTASVIRGCDGALFGATQSPSHLVEGYSSPILALRKQLDLYANLRPVMSMPVPGSRPNIDLLIVRENTECLYVRQERLEDDGKTAVAQRVITRRASERIARKAFDQACARSTARTAQRPPLVTIVHKANVLSITDGLFRTACLDVARDFPDVQVEEQLVDSMVYRLIREPERYDVVVAPNLYGDIISDAAAALVGGLGLASSANASDNFVLAEPVHGSAPDIAGKGIANPVAAILAAAQLLEALGETNAAGRIRQAVHHTLAAGVLGPDLGGTAGTQEITERVITQLQTEKTD